MKQSNFNQLTPRQQHVLLLSMFIRNALENFHARHLTDQQMAELNPIIRQALYDATTALEHQTISDQGFEYLIASIPEYWEIPSSPSGIGD